MAKTGQGNGLDMRDNIEKLKLNDKSSYGSDPEVNGNVNVEEKRVDKYGFTGGAQQYSAEA